MFSTVEWNVPLSEHPDHDSDFYSFFCQVTLFDKKEHVPVGGSRFTFTKIILLLLLKFVFFLDGTYSAQPP